MLVSASDPADDETPPRGAVELPAADLERARLFYCAVLGLDAVDALELPVRFRPKSTEQLPAVELQAPAPSDRETRPCLRIDLDRGLERAIVTAWNCGGQIVELQHHLRRGVQRALIADPDGNIVELWSRQS
jgi:predicted enzyme related to lactoylglutathione lyase